jgi:hypothetical protein
VTRWHADATTAISRPLSGLPTESRSGMGEAKQYRNPGRWRM